MIDKVDVFFLVMLAISGTGIGITGVWVESSIRKEIQDEAIERGYAEWVIDPQDGSTTWQWKEQSE